MTRVSPRRSRPHRLITALRIVSAMTRVSPRRSRPRRLITALRIVLCHDQSQPPSIPASPLDHCPTNRLCYDRSQLLSIQPSQLDLSLSSRELGIGFHLSSKRSCRGGKRKQRKVSVVSGVRAASTTSNDVRRSPGTRSADSRHLAPVTDVANDVPPRSRTPYSSRGVRFANLIPVSVQASTATSSPSHAIEDHKGTVL